MKPLEFSQPGTLADTIALLQKEGSNAGMLSGGTDLIIQWRASRKSIQHMVDIKNIPELNVLSYDDSTGLRLGAAVSCATLGAFGPAKKHYPALVEGAELIGSTQIQNRCTVGGNVCNGSPAADTICALIVLNAVCIVEGPGGRREITARDIMTGPGQTALKEAEILVEFKLPPPAKNSSSGYLRFIPRNEMDIAVASAGANLGFADDGKTVKSASISIGAVAPTPLVVEAAAQALVGSQLEDSALSAAARASEAAANPITDQRGTVEYRKHLAGVLTRRAIEIAANRAKGV